MDNWSQLNLQLEKVGDKKDAASTQGSSSSGSGSSYFAGQKNHTGDEESDDQSHGNGKKVGQVEYRVDIYAYLKNGFVDPNTVAIPSCADNIKEGDERFCIISVLYSVNELYLIFAENFPENLNEFVKYTRDQYKKKINGPRRSGLIGHPEIIKPGSIVCVRDFDDMEWMRAEVLEIKDKSHNVFYRVQYLDLGEYHEVHRMDTLYLLKEVAAVRKYAVRARLQLSSFYNGSEHRMNDDWNKKFSDNFLKRIYDKRILVKFIRQEKINDESVWEVSLLRLQYPHKDFNMSVPLEQQMIQMLEGRYVHVSNLSGKEEKARGSK